MFHSFFFNSLEGLGTYPSFHFLSDLFCGQPVTWKVYNFASFLFFFFLLTTTRSGLLAEIKWSVCMSKSYRSLCVVSFSRTAAGLCIYRLFVWSNLNFLHIPQWITLPTQSCLLLYSFCANFLHSLIMWLMVSSLSSHITYILLFCCVLSILTLKWLVLMALFCWCY